VAPKLVKATVDGGGRVVDTPPSATHRVVSATVAREVTAMLTEVVRGGTGTAAAINDYQVAGKTGTARKSFEGQQGYATASYVSSFAGFVPATDPSFTAMVVLDQPTPIFGGTVAAPVFHDIGTYALRQLHVPPAAADPGLFLGVPHAQPSSATAADEPGKAGQAAGPSVSSPSTLLDPPPPAVPTPTTTTTTPTTSTTVGPGASPPGASPPGAHPPGAAPPPPTARGAPPTTSLLSPVAPVTTTTTTNPPPPPPPPTTSTTRPKGPGSVVHPSGSPSSVPAAR
jgi:membrane peptidoglycan carboxypeptidase